ncbi:MAG: hypothetical protein AAGF99_17525 [Bacteroidota bacterium]
MTAPTFAAALADHVLATLPGDQPLRREMLEALPAPLAHFLDRWLAQHVGRVDATLQSPWVAETPEVAAIRADLVATMQHFAQVPVERLPQVMRYASGRVVGFLVAPMEVFVKTVEESGTGPYPVEAVLGRLAWFAGRPTLTEVLRSYFDWKGTQHVTAGDLRRLVPQIDERLAQEESPSDWIDRLAPLYDLAAVLDGERRLPAALLRAHFAARGLDETLLADSSPAVSEAELLALLQVETPRVPVSAEALAIEDDDLGFTSPAVAVDEAEPASPPEDAVSTDDADTVESAPPAAEPLAASVPLGARSDQSSDVPASALDAPLTPLEGHAAPDASPGATAESPPDAAAPLPDDAAPPVSQHGAPDARGTMPPASDAVSPPPDPDPEASRPATIEEATRDEQPLWSQYAAPETPNVNDRFADPDVPSPAQTADGEVPLWKRYFSGGDSGPAPAEAPLPSEDDLDVRPGAVEASTASEPPIAAQAPPDEAPSALERRLLGSAADQHDWFVEQLTAGDEAAYEATLRAIDQATSWTEASQIIAQDIFRRYSVYIWSAPARAFTDAIEAHFRTART